jgi:hypothetical protein
MNSRDSFWPRMKVWLKVIRFGVLVGALFGFLWGSGLLGFWAVLTRPASVTARHWPENDFGPGYFHRLWTYPLYGGAVGIPLACLVALNKDWRYFITKEDYSDDNEES